MKGMPFPKDDQPSCHRRCLHRMLVEAYRDARTAWEERRENGQAMQMEDDDYAAAYPPPTFKAWLTGAAQQPVDYPESVPA